MNNLIHNSKKAKTKINRKSLYQSKITRTLLLQYLFTLFSFIVLYFVFLSLAWSFSNSFIWYSGDPVYHILHLIKEYILLVTFIIFLIGWVIITYHYIAKPLRYLDKIIAASEQLTVSTDTPITLPPTLKNVESELNFVREQSIRNANLTKEAEQRKNDLIVYLAHDLKTPLTSVIGYLTLLLDEPQLSSELRESYTGIALDKAQRLEDLINEFFDITRLNLTTLTLYSKQVDLSRMMAQMVSEFGPLLTEKELTISASIAPNVHILCDPDKLARVFDNLIRNAVNYSYTNSSIFLSMEQTRERVSIIVSNHGETIPPNQLEHIFEQFFRLDSSRSSTTGGSGLGLAISKEIVELHGGSIQAQSAEESIVFTIELPLDCKKIV